MLSSSWPLFDLRLRTPRLELRPPADGDLEEILEVIGAGIHDPAEMPFGVAWTDVESPEREWNALKWYWRQRAELSPESWSVTLAVFTEGRFVGIQDVMAQGFLAKGIVSTGSWLGQPFQGQGIGKEMRTAVLFLAFDGLGADIASSESFLDNQASIAVSRAVGYEEDGYGRLTPRGERRDTIRWRLTGERFEKLRADGHYAAYEPIEIEGLEPCLPLLGLGV